MDFVRTRSFVTVSQEPVIGSYTEVAESNPNPPFLFRYGAR
jgi:hypothetical protein